MFRNLMKTAIAIILLSIVQNIDAQEATEIYIPVGQSPGLSGEYTTLGKISKINTNKRTISMSDSAGSYNLKITDKTKIWLDRSKLKLRNKKGSIKDVREGMLAEVKYQKNKQGGSVEWIKVQLVE
ncbi:MAG TPA: hypothetical protein EYP51_03030 [Thiotrichales bacterium]|nr:hypothetical protein [Thiotrichales bacterium]